MTIDTLGTLASARPDRGAAVDLLPTASRAPAVRPMTATAVNATDSTQKTAKDSAGTLDELKDAVDQLNSSSHAQSLEFSIDEDSKRTIVKVIDVATKEVLRQMPSEEALRIAKALDRGNGLLISLQA